ncbi:hypothetical protein QQM41_04635 [Acetobacter sp. AC2005]|uniref:hypothetical protein n=1 Tax=Acetobacter sp. AC2005 TaxID=3134142 RepID=UPI0030D254E5
MLQEAQKVTVGGGRSGFIIDISRYSLCKCYDCAFSINRFIPEFGLALAPDFLCEFSVRRASAFEYAFAGDSAADIQVFRFWCFDELEGHSMLSMSLS